jgi:hypothetical protein
MVADLARFHLRQRTDDEVGTEPTFLTAEHQPGLLGRRLGSIHGRRKEIGRLG